MEEMERINWKYMKTNELVGLLSVFGERRRVIETMVNRKQN